MNTDNIRYSSRFKKRYSKLDPMMKDRVKKTLALFKSNPIYPSLRLHKLSGKLEGYWSISVNRNYRIIIEIEDECITLISVGTHAIYN